MDTLLIIGAGPLQLPAFHEARRMGLRVVAIDRNPDAPGMALADTAHPVDTQDGAGAIDVARHERVAGVMTLCTDYPVRTVAAVAEALRLPGFDPATALRATHKGRMREAFARTGAPSMGYALVRGEEQMRNAVTAIGIPCIVKPIASSGSRGVYKLNRLEDAAAAFEHASAVDGPDAELILEEFVDGPEVSVEVVSHGGRQHVVAITDKRTTEDPHWVEIGHVQSSRLDERTRRHVVDAAISGLEALGIHDSAAHVEIRIGSNGPRLIEIGARLGGDYISTVLARLSTGVNMVEAAICLALGRSPNVVPTAHRGAAIAYLTPAPGIVRSIEGLEAARAVPGVEEVQLEVRAGDRVTDLRSSLDRVGHVIASGPDAPSADAAVLRAAALVDVRTSRSEKT